MVLRQQFRQRSRARFVERGQKLSFGLASLQKIIFRGRTPFKNAD
jgi:hypothetical protein